MGEELNFDNILTGSEIDNLFTDYEESSVEDTQTNTTEKTEETTEKELKELTTEDVNPNSLFDYEGEDSESVGSGKDNKEQESSSSREEGTSPNSNFYSSIAKALEEDGVFPDLSTDDIKDINDAESLRKAIDKQIESGLDERQKRINTALGLGVPPEPIKQYESALQYLNSISEEMIENEGEEGEKIRRSLIYQDLVNRGYGKEKAEREVKKSFGAGSDIEDAKEALAENKQFFGGEYTRLIETAKEATRVRKEQMARYSQDLKKSILEDKDTFGELSVDKSTRKKIYENLTKPVYKNPESGEFLTAIQKYHRENELEFNKNLGLVFTLTDGFKNLDGLIKSKVKKEVAKGMRNLENVINSTSRNSDGSLDFIGSRHDENSFFKGYTLDV